MTNWNTQRRDYQEDLTSNICQVDPLVIYKEFYSTADYTFFSSTHGVYVKTDYMVNHKTSLNQFKMIDIIKSKHFLGAHIMK